MDGFRHEYKYVIDAFQLATIRQELAVAMKADDHVLDGSYSIRSLYFDDWENSCYHDNEDGASPREKCRIRIYNASMDFIRLEWKTRDHNMIRKQSCPMQREQVERLLAGERLRWNENMDTLLKKLYIRQELSLFQPKVIVEYDRIPFVERNGNVRVTLDMNMRAAKPRDFFRESLSARPIMPMDTQLLEAKFDELLPDYLHTLIEAHQLKRSTFSKYYYCRKFGGI